MSDETETETPEQKLKRALVEACQAIDEMKGRSDLKFLDQEARKVIAMLMDA